MIPELGATIATFAITTLWLGPCDVVYLWSCLNCFGLNFELWVQKLAELEPLAQIEVSREGLGLGLAGALEWVALLTSGVFQPRLPLSPELSHHHPPGHQGYDSCGCLALPYLLQGGAPGPVLCAGQCLQQNVLLLYLVASTFQLSILCKDPLPL